MVYTSPLCGDSERDSKERVLWCYAGKCKNKRLRGEGEESFRVFFGVLADRMVLVPTL